MRAIAICLVIVSHLLPLDLPIYSSSYWVLISGHTGVQIFFALSGFLITFLLLQEYDKHKRINVRFFFARRFLRLLPPFLLFFVLVVILKYFGHLSIPESGIVMAFFYLFNFYPKEPYIPELIHTWSLAVEEQFYLFWVFVMAFIPKKMVSYIALLLIVFSAVIYYQIDSFELSKKYTLYRWFIPAVSSILIGALFAIYQSKLSKIPVKGFIALFCYISPSLLTVLLPVAAIVQAVGVGFFLLYLLENQNSRFVLVFNMPVLRYLGKISYGVYLYQGLFLRTGPGGLLSVQQFPYNIIIVMILSALSYEFIEKRALKYKQKFKVI